MRSRFLKPTGAANPPTDKADKKREAPQPRPPETEVETRLAPDPFTAVLPALAALGAIASIATINWAAQERTPDRSRAKRKAGTALRDLETCCLGLQEIFRRFQRSGNRHDALLFAILIDEQHPGNPDVFVHARAVLDGRRVVRTANRRQLRFCCKSADQNPRRRI